MFIKAWNRYIYGRDGALVSFLGETGSFYRVSPVSIEGEWWVPRRYVKLLSDSTQFNHVVVVDRGDQNIATLERLEEGTWAIRSMNPATTGMHRPPYAQETPLGMFVVQQKKSRMVFLKESSSNFFTTSPGRGIRQSISFVSNRSR